MSPANTINGANALQPDPYAYGARVIDLGEWRRGSKPQPRRPSRAQETSLLHRGRAIAAIPVEARAARSQFRWLRDSYKWIQRLPRRADAKRTIVTISRAIGLNADWTTLTTTTLTWDRLAITAGVSRRTVARCLAFLHAHGWIGRVAAGRSATAKQAAGLTGPDASQNDAPVYLLTQPATTRQAQTGTPPTQGGYKGFLHTREEKTPDGAATRPSHLSGAAVAGRTTTQVSARRTGPLWPRHQPIKQKRDRIRAAAEIQRQVFIFRKLPSERYLAWLLKDFFAAEWTVADILHAIDVRPDGLPQGHEIDGQWVAYTGADGISTRGLPHWLNYRLNVWRDETGTVVPSHSQTAEQRARRQAEREDQRAQAIARAREERANHSSRNRSGDVASEEKRRAMNTMRKLTGARFRTLTKHMKSE